MNPKDGLIVACAHGPKDFVMRYKSPGVRGEKFLGTNPWVDFTTLRPIRESRSELKKYLPKNH